MKSSFLFIFSFFGLALGFSAEPPAVRASVYSQFTLVVCNKNAPGSEDLARYYASAREIASRNVIVLDCPTTEEISRKDFVAKIHDPLRDALLAGGWWMPTRDAETGKQSLRSEIKVLALMHGVPVKIREEKFVTDSGKISAASVDSELCTLGQPGLTTEGPLANPYYGSEVPFHSANLPIMLVGRVDGPNAKICRRMIDDTIKAEVGGLWGQAYVDSGAGSGVSQAWLDSATAQLRRIGIPVMADSYRDPLPTMYPMGDPILYYGSGHEMTHGPFLKRGIVLQPGAVACHVHPRNGATLRSSEEHWAGPLLARGASSVLCNAYETPDELAHQLDLFTNRLTRGFTFIESAYIAQQGVSWTNLAIGDPLYVPFPNLRNSLDQSQFHQESEAMPYQVLRVAYARWGEGNPFPERTLFYKLELATAKNPKPELFEHLALSALETGDYDEARIQLKRAEAAYTEPRDKLRMKLHEGEMYRRQKDRLDAFKAFRNAAQEFPDLPESEAAVEWMNTVKGG
ncbi:MAG: TIGR03790 family protein [Verrucomicrobiota bacterium]